MTAPHPPGGANSAHRVVIDLPCSTLSPSAEASSPQGAAAPPSALDSSYALCTFQTKKNIFLSADAPCAKITDFGLAIGMSRSVSLATSQVGTPTYMAPEVRRA